VNYRAYRERVRSYLAELPDEDQAKVLGGTAARVFELDDAGTMMRIATRSRGTCR
jgi:hypothetical protein